MKIAVIGATGLVGNKIVEHLCQLPLVEEVYVIVRKPFYSHEKIVEIIQPNMSPESIEALKVNADVFICALGTTIKIAGSQEMFKYVDFELVKAFGTLAKNSNAKSLIVVSALGASKKSLFFYNRVKGEMEQSIKDLNVLSTYIYRPSLLIGEREEKRFGEKIGISVVSVLMPLLPKVVSAKLGTRVEDIVQYTDKQLHQLKIGTHIVERFN